MKTGISNFFVLYCPWSNRNKNSFGNFIVFLDKSVFFNLFSYLFHIRAKYTIVEKDLLFSNHHYFKMKVNTLGAPDGRWFSSISLPRMQPIEASQFAAFSVSSATLFLVGGAAQANYSLGRRGGTPTLGWRHCPRHGLDPFGNGMPLPTYHWGPCVGPQG